MKRNTWRDECRPIIERVLSETAGKTEKEIRTALVAAYPFGARENHPYKIWCDEIREQRGLKAEAKREASRAAGQAEMFTD